MFLQKYFSTLIENIDEAVLAVDKDGRLTIINKTAQQLLSISKENIGSYAPDVVHGTKLTQILKTGEYNSNKTLVVNGRRLSENIIPLITNGTILGALSIIRQSTNHINTVPIDNETYVDILDTIMNTLNECIVLVNQNGIITMMSKAYKNFLNCSNPEGKKVVDIIENTRLHEVIKNGNTEIGTIQEIKGNKMIAMRVPIKKGNKILGAIGKVMFKDISDFYTLSKKLNNLQKEIEFYKNALKKEKKAKYSIENIIGNSPKIKKVKSLALRVAKTNSNVLITGESGTGKELVAHGIHNASNRYLASFIEINCASIPPELFESELFGYEEGAFTGAKKGGKKGKFELADGGTIFLDEIGDMPLYMQVKLLKVIQDREIQKIGSVESKKIDVRIISATNKNLEKSIKSGEFREDLYYRLNVMRIVLPPLRDRKEDIPILANSLKIKVANRLGIYVEGMSKEVVRCLMKYDWPGNVRELENIIERAVNMLDSDLVINLEHLPSRLTANNFKKPISSAKEGYLKEIIQNMEKEIIADCLEKNNWNKNKTARILGISRVNLYNKIKTYKLM